VLAAFGAGVAATLAIQRATPTPAPAANDRLAWARRLAVGEEARLLEEHGPFLAVLESHDADEILWAGVERLARAAALEPSAERKALVRRLERLVAVHTPPAGYPALAQSIRALARTERR
jgi:hypothetical protein